MVSDGLEMQTKPPRQQAFVEIVKRSFNTPLLLTPSELCSVQPAALWGPAFKAYRAALAPTAKDNEHRYFHAKSLFETCVSLSRSVILE